MKVAHNKTIQKKVIQEESLTEVTVKRVVFSIEDKCVMIVGPEIGRVTICEGGDFDTLFTKIEADVKTESEAKFAAIEAAQNS